MSNINLKPCPFCGGKVKLQLVDDEGNWRYEDYLENPYSGIGYVIVHDTDMANELCPIATFPSDRRAQGIWIYSSQDEAIESWDRRSGEQNEQH